MRISDWSSDVCSSDLSVFEADGGKGPIARNLEPERVEAIRRATGLKEGDAVFFACDRPEKAAKFAGAVRLRLGADLGLVEPGVFHFCWIVDYPMYELNEQTNKVEFSHNPFSMPQGRSEEHTSELQSLMRIS